MSKKKYPPKGSIVRSIASRSLSWRLALFEWIDNAFDAAKNKDVSVSEIKIFIGNKSVRVTDNSKGHDRLASMVQLGAHDQHDTTQIGEFGIGAKDAALWIGGESSVIMIDLDAKKKWFTYAIEAVDQQMVKVGHSIDVPRRLEELRIASPHQLRLLGAIKGDNEAALHRLLRSEWCCGEWFSMSDRTVEVLTSVGLYGAA